MGYTHYFEYKLGKDFQRGFAQFCVEDFSRIVKWAETVDPECHVIGFNEELEEFQASAPLVTEGGLIISGAKPGAENDDDSYYSHETLIIESDPISVLENWVAKSGNEYARYKLDEMRKTGRSGGFCKTARKPYDLIVSLTLLRMATTVPGFTIGSDGSWDAEWLHGASYWDEGCERSFSARQGMREVFGEDPSCPW